jgi:cytidylate kinase
MTEVVPVVAIDGPGGAGKGTVAGDVATQLGWHLLDSGALYRLVALDAINNGVGFDDIDGLVSLAQNLDVRFDHTGAEACAYLRGLDVTGQIREEACGLGASQVAAIVAVREGLIERQRGFQREPGLIADGRDMGSVVFPDARLKIFLTASLEERALRRHKQLKDKGIDVSLPALSSDMAARDERDTTRSVAPLRACEDARVLDSTRLSITEVVSTVLQWVEEVYPGHRHN